MESAASRSSIAPRSGSLRKAFETALSLVAAGAVAFSIAVVTVEVAAAGDVTPDASWYETL